MGDQVSVLERTPSQLHTFAGMDSVVVAPCRCRSVSLSVRVVVGPCRCRSVSLSVRVVVGPCRCRSVRRHRLSVVRSLAAGMI